MANSQRPTDKQDAGDTSSVIGTFEQIAKVLGLIFGGFYVLGLVISNAELQRLGLSDFSILQPRCIATGALFALYMIFVMLLLAPIVALLLGAFRLVQSSKRVITRIGLIFVLVAACGLIEILALLFAGNFYGGLTPWIVIYPPEGEFIRQQMEQMKLSFSDRMHLISEYAHLVWSGIGFGWNLFGHYWAAFTAGIGVAWITVELAGDMPDGTRGLEGRRLLIVGTAVVVFAYAAPGFARDVYPNIDQSVGGGQPTIARLQISGTLPLIEDGKTFRRVSEETSGKETKSFIVTEPVIIWYQSASFIYVSLLTVNDRRQRPIAIDAKSVQIIQQLPQAVEIYDGTRVIAVHDLR
jgi:hypothetical protein